MNTEAAAEEKSMDVQQHVPTKYNATPSRPLPVRDVRLERTELVTIPEQGRNYVAFVFGAMNAVQFIRTYHPT